MTKPIADKAEIALEYPDKLYVGTFERSSRFEASVDSTGIALILERPGADDIRKSIHMHINFGLFADILRDRPPLDAFHALHDLSADRIGAYRAPGCHAV
jgi:hypothetical protein